MYLIDIKVNESICLFSCPKYFPDKSSNQTSLTPVTWVLVYQRLTYWCTVSPDISCPYSLFPAMGQGHTAEGMSPGMFQELAGICDLYRQQSQNPVR